MIVVVTAIENNIIGRHGQLPYKLKDNDAFFKRLTIGKVVIMDKKTYKTHGGLKSSRNIVIGKCGRFEDFESFETIEEASHNYPLCYVIDGDQVIKNAWHMMDTLYVTRLQSDSSVLDIPKDMRLVNTFCFDANNNNEQPFRIEEWRRIKPF